MENGLTGNLFNVKLSFAVNVSINLSIQTCTSFFSHGAVQAARTEALAFSSSDQKCYLDGSSSAAPMHSAKSNGQKLSYRLTETPSYSSKSS